jgi:hypothetical protein
MPHNAAWPAAVGAAPSASRAHRTDCPSVRWPCHPQAFIGVRGTPQQPGVSRLAGGRSLSTAPPVRGYDHRVILRCTRKLLRLLGTELAADPVPGAEDW